MKHLYENAFNAAVALNHARATLPRSGAAGKVRAEWIVEKVDGGTLISDLSLALGISKERVRQIYLRQKRLTNTDRPIEGYVIHP